MITVSKKTEEEVQKSPYLREAMSDGLINLSALARKIQPAIQAELMKQVTVGSIFAALQRMQSNMQPYYTSNPAQYLDNLGVKSDLLEIAVNNAPNIAAVLANLSDEANTRSNYFFVTTRLMNETTVILSKALEAELLEKVGKSEIVRKVDGLAGLTLNRTHDQIETTGILQYPLRILAWKEISVVEIVTTLTEMIIIVQETDIDEAFVALRNGLKSISAAEG